MATKKLQVLANLGPTDAKIKSAVEDYFVDHPIDSTVVDKLCPTFTESGSIAVCEPVEGYPLEVVTAVAEAGELTLQHSGKNLFDFNQGVSAVNYTNANGVGSKRNGYAIRLPAGTYTLKANNPRHNNQYIYGCINGADGSHKGKCDLVQATSIKKQTVTIEDGDVIYIYDGQEHTITKSNEVFAAFDIQLEVGSSATTYEPYCGQTYTAEAAEAGAYNWPAIAALPGTNYLYSDSGDTTVIGRADPTVVIEKLTNAIIALGGTV